MGRARKEKVPLGTLPKNWKLTGDGDSQNITCGSATIRKVPARAALGA
jgi:hypothetical protein